MISVEHEIVELMRAKQILCLEIEEYSLPRRMKIRSINRLINKKLSEVGQDLLPFAHTNHQEE